MERRFRSVFDGAGKYVLERLKLNLEPKVFIPKIIVALTLALAIFVSSFVIRDRILSGELADNGTPFIQYRVVEPNKGISFGIGQDLKWLVYTLQVTVTVIAFIIFLMVSSWWHTIPVAMVLWGGMANLIDRGLVDVFDPKIVLKNGVIPDLAGYSDAVVDYFKFSFSERFGIFNMPDTYIIVGVAIGIVMLVTEPIIEWSKEKKKKKAEEGHDDTSGPQPQI